MLDIAHSSPLLSVQLSSALINQSRHEVAAGQPEVASSTVARRWGMPPHGVLAMASLWPANKPPVPVSWLSPRLCLAKPTLVFTKLFPALHLRRPSMFFVREYSWCHPRASFCACTHKSR